MSLDSRSFVGCGGEEYLRDSITSELPPVGIGLREEVVGKQTESRWMFEELMEQRPGVSGDPLPVRDLAPDISPKPVNPAPRITVVGDPHTMTVGRFLEAIGFCNQARQECDGHVLKGSGLQKCLNDLVLNQHMTLADWLLEFRMHIKTFRSLLPRNISFRPAVLPDWDWEPTVLTSTPSTAEVAPLLKEVHIDRAMTNGKFLDLIGWEPSTGPDLGLNSVLNCMSEARQSTVVVWMYFHGIAPYLFQSLLKKRARIVFDI